MRPSKSDADTEATQSHSKSERIHNSQHSKPESEEDSGYAGAVAVVWFSWIIHWKRWKKTLSPRLSYAPAISCTRFLSTTFSIPMDIATWLDDLDFNEERLEIDGHTLYMKWGMYAKPVEKGERTVTFYHTFHGLRLDDSEDSPPYEMVDVHQFKVSESFRKYNRYSRSVWNLANKTVTSTKFLNPSCITRCGKIPSHGVPQAASNSSQVSLLTKYSL